MTNKWESVLVEWINCLSLTKPIKKLDDLRNGDFFAALQKLLQNASLDQDVLTFLFKLFDNNYKHFSFENKQNVHLNDICLEDITYITSLLLHYTCTIDRRSMLTTPLYDLDQWTQITIKNFLEKANSKLTKAGLKTIVETCGCVELNKSEYLSSGYSPQSRQSPLQALLKTPLASRGFFEKDREIARLKAALETERYDKSDLQLEFNLQKDKLVKSEKLLAQKTSELSLLREEIVALENRTPPHYQDIDARELQKRLRCEIQTLEQILAQSDKEQDQLKLDFAAAKESNRSLEAQCALWQEKFVTADGELQSLEETSKEQARNLNDLQEHCRELENLLYELRKSSNENSLAEESLQNSVLDRRISSSFSSCESLAQTVVEVQLREVRKENEELKETTFRIQEHVNRLAEKLNEKQDKFNALFDEKERMVIKLSRTENVAQKLSDEKEELTKKLLQMSEEVDNLNEERIKEAQKNTDLNATNLQLNENILNKRELNEKSAKLIKELTNEKLQLIKINEDKDSEISKLFAESRDLIAEIENDKRKTSELQKVIDEFKIETADLNAKVLDLTGELKESVQQIEGKTSENAELSATVKELSARIATLEEEIKEGNKELLKSNKSNEDLQSAVDRMQSSIVELEKGVAEKIHEVLELEDKLEVETKNVADYEMLIQESSIKLNELQSAIEYLHNSLDKVERGTLELQERLAESCSNLITEKENARKCIEAKEMEIAGLEEVIEKATANARKLNEQLINNEQESTKKIAELNSTLNQMQTSIESFEKEKCSKSLQIHNLENALEKCSEELGTEVHTTTLMKDKIVMLEIVVDATNTKLQRLTLSLNEQIQKGLSEARKNRELQSVLTQWQQKLDAISKRNNENVAEIDKLKKMLEDGNKDFEMQAKNAAQLLQEKTTMIGKLQTLLENSTTSSDELEFQIKVMRAGLLESNERNVELESLLDGLQEHNTVLDEEIVELKNTLAKTTEDFKIEKQALNKSVEEKTSEIEKLERAAKESDGKIEELSAQLIYSNNINEEMKSRVKSEVDQMQKFIDEFEQQKLATTQEITSLKNMLAKSAEELEFQKINAAKLVENVKNIVEESKKELLASNTELEVSQAQKRSSIAELEEEIAVKSRDIEDLKLILSNASEKLQNEAESSAAKIQTLTNENSEIATENNNLKLTLSKTDEELNAALLNVVQLEQTVSGQLTTISAVEEQNTKLVLNLSRLNEKRDNELEELGKKNEMVKDEADKLLQEIQGVETRNLKAIEEKNALLNDLEETLEGKCQEIEELVHAKQELEEKHEKELKEATNQLQELSTKNSKFIEEYKKEILLNIDNLLVKTERLEVRCSKWKMTHDKTERKYQATEKQLTKVLQELQETKFESQMELLDLTKTLHDVVEKYNQCELEREQLQDRLDEMSSEFETMKANEHELQAIQKHYEESKLKLDNVQQENADLAAKLDDKINEFQTLQNKFESVFKENQSVAQNEAIIEQMKSEASSILEEISCLKYDKQTLESRLELCQSELGKVKNERNEIIESQIEIMKETEEKIVRASAHENDLISERKLRKNAELELANIREAYAKVVSENSLNVSDNERLRKLLDERTKQIGDFLHVKDAYEKMLEENNKLVTEVDTVKYKRGRDRDEYVRLLKKEQEGAAERECKKVREIRSEYETKLEKMKEKMLKLYREEVQKEMSKVKTDETKAVYFQKTIDDLRNELFDSEQKVMKLENALHRFKTQQNQMRLGSRESLQMRKMGSSSSIGSLQRNERKVATLPTRATMYEETVTTTRRTSMLPVPGSIGQNLQMEDEEDSLFNDKFLTDLKQGNCSTAFSLGGRESNASRLSELAWRNSLVPPHLKSSYPLETQAVSPNRFKDDDMKAGNMNLDDSLCKLLPGEKPTRQRKDAGTTSYKKPGPPTPSKNGGRLSLQGNEIHPLRESNDQHRKVPTPSRIKEFFRLSTSNRENTENTPRTKRLNIFRKQR